jgi:hypothetical protein
MKMSIRNPGGALLVDRDLLKLTATKTVRRRSNQGAGNLAGSHLLANRLLASHQQFPMALVSGYLQEQEVN